MSIEVRLWFYRAGGEVVQLPFQRPIEVSAKGEIQAAPRGEESDPASVLLARLDGASDACAAVLVPREHGDTVRLNGIDLSVGMHLLANRDRLDVGGKIFWVSRHGFVEETVYDPQVHGEECYCARSKARIETGDDILICPGTPDTPCGTVYRASAWKKGVRCHSNNCGFDPSAPAWKPAAPQNGSRLEELLELARHQNHGG